MTAPDPTDVARKLRQHDNEFEAVYDLLRVVDGKIDALEAKVDTGFARLDTGFARLDTGFARLESGFARLDTGFARLESGQQQILDMLRSGRGTSSSD